jgi:hypothetical protein
MPSLINVKRIKQIPFMSADFHKDPARVKGLEDQTIEKLRKLWDIAKTEIEEAFQTVTEGKHYAAVPGFDADDFDTKVEAIIQERVIDPSHDVFTGADAKAYRHGREFAQGFLTVELGDTPEARRKEWSRIEKLVKKNDMDMARIGSKTQSEIRRVIGDGIKNERDFRDIQKDIMARVDVIGVTRSATMVRTETQRAVNDGVKDTYEKADVQVFERLEALDEKTCTDWEFNIGGRIYRGCAAINGQQFTREEADQVDEQTHPNCVHPDTVIKKEGIVSAFNARYDGPMIEVFLSEDRKVTVTPNHMFLTDRGFAAADFLRKGDHVFYCTGFERIVTDDPDDDNRPSRIEDIVESLAMSGGMATERVPVAPEDLHGDGRFCDGDVDIIRPYSLLGHAGKTTALKPPHTGQLYPAGKSNITLFGDSPLQQFLKGAALATDGGMSGSRQSSPFFLTRSRHTGLHSGVTISDRDTRINKSGQDGTFRDSETLRDLTSRFARHITLHNIVDIKVIQYHGQVYDIQTISTLYCGNGFVMSNCRGTWIPVVDIPETT